MQFLLDLLLATDIHPLFLNYTVVWDRQGREDHAYSYNVDVLLCSCFDGNHTEGVDVD